MKKILFYHQFNFKITQFPLQELKLMLKKWYKNMKTLLKNQLKKPQTPTYGFKKPKKVKSLNQN